ncbi:hypothetical protein EVAR_29002_1 [Eumeta japonica]|uniref:Uncharacterized protein n=1 Tax=Eumeta variegata TaxID=151549 RepID=A0A4C1W500_EUMVA|nr:hypothetical protein EVAR_29002_1 [Eumeta japonica]
MPAHLSRRPLMTRHATRGSTSEIDGLRYSLRCGAKFRFHEAVKNQRQTVAVRREGRAPASSKVLTLGRTLHCAREFQLQPSSSVVRSCKSIIDKVNPKELRTSPNMVITMDFSSIIRTLYTPESFVTDTGSLLLAVYLAGASITFRRLVLGNCSMIILPQRLSIYRTCVRSTLSIDVPAMLGDSEDMSKAILTGPSLASVPCHWRRVQPKDVYRLWA